MNRTILRLPVLILLAALAACGQHSDDARLAAALKHIAARDTAAATIELKNLLQSNPNSGEARLLLGKVQLDGGDAAGAEVELNRALAAGQSADAVLPSMARALLELGKAEQLAQRFSGAQLRDDQARAELLAHVATAHMSLGALEEAATAIDTALRRVSSHLPARVLRARLAAVRGDVAGALAQSDELLVRSDGEPAVWLLRAELLSATAGADKTSAIDAYRKAIALKPDLVGPHAGLLSLLISLERIDDATTQWGEMKQALPRQPETLYFETVLALKRADFGRARELVQPLLRAAPNNPRVLLLAGQAEAQLGATAQAEVLLRRAVEVAPEAVQARLALATVLVRMGEAGRALATLKPLIEEKDPDPDALTLAARAHLMSGDRMAADAALSRAARLKPGDVRIRTWLALLRSGRTGADAALRELETVAAADAGGLGYMALFNARLGRGELDAALKAAEALAARQPDKAMPDYLRGGLALRRADPVDARRHFEAALAKEPGFVPAVTVLAEMDLAEGKPTARARYEALIKLDPRNVRVRLQHAELTARTGGGREEVARLLGEAVLANPAEPAARIALIDLHLGSGNIPAAFEAAKSAAAVIPDNVELLDRLGRTQMAVGESNQAVASFNRLKTLLPKSAWPQLRLAEAYRAKNDLDGQRAVVRRALELEPRSLFAQRAAIMVAQQDKDPTRALGIARTVQSQRPEEPSGYAMEGEIHLAEKRYDQAAEAFRKAMTKPQSSALGMRLHLALTRGEKDDEARRFAERWRQDRPDDMGFVLHLGELASGKGDLAAAENHYREVLARQPANVVALNNLAFVLLKADKPGALPLAQQAVALAPALPAALDTLAMAHAAQGDTAKALDWQRKAVALAPTSVELRQHLADLYRRAGDRKRAREQLDAVAKLKTGLLAEPARTGPGSASTATAGSGSPYARLLELLPMVAIALASLTGLLLVGVVITAAARPAGFRVERSVSIASPAQHIFGLLRDLSGWSGWSNWEPFAPGATRRIGGGAGSPAYCEWESADKRRSGHLAIVHAEAPGTLVVEAHRARPTPEIVMVEFVLSADGGATLVRSVESGPAPFATRVGDLLSFRNQRRAARLAADLKSLKAMAEDAPAEASADDRERFSPGTT